MRRSDYALAVLSAAGEQASFSPVQVQKLFFILDREIPNLVGGPYFAFEPYDFGPFDKDVYREIEILELDDRVEQSGGGSYRRYSLTTAGLTEGRTLLAGLQAPVRDYIAEIAAWVRSLSFSQLVSAIYRDYPEMKEKSIFQQ